MIVLDVGGIESMGVVWDLIVTRVAGNSFGWEGGWSKEDWEYRRARQFDGRFMLLLLLWFRMLFACF